MKLIAAALALLAAGAARGDGAALVLPPALGTPGRVWVAGRVLVEEQGRRGPAAVRNARLLSARNLPGAPVHVSFHGRAAHGVAGHDGEFEVEVTAAPGAPFPPGPGRATVVAPGVTAEAVVHVVPADAPFLVVSDLDDTVVVTNVASKRAVLASTFLRDADTQPVVPGMAAFYRCLALRPGAAAPAFAYVSGSPVQLAPRVARFLERHAFPPAALFLRNLGPGTLSGYKEPVLARLAERFPQPLVLVGDSGEKDPEIYAAFAAAHPGRVLATYVRRAGPSPGPASPFPGQLLFDDPAVAARHAAEAGLAPPGCAVPAR